MIRHRGFHYGDWGTWDPRSDVFILDKQKIDYASTKFLMPDFHNLVHGHEFSHRFFYKSKSIQQILLFSEYLKIQITTQQFLKQWKSPSSNARQMLNYYFNYMDDVGNVLDVAHVFFLYGKHKESNLDPSELKKHSRIILGEKSKRILNDFEWFDSNVEDWPFILNLIFNFSLQLKFCESETVSNKGAMPGVVFSFNLSCPPSDLFFKFIDIFRAIYEINSTKGKLLAKRILSFHKRDPPPTYFELQSLIQDLEKYDPSLREFIAYVSEDGYQSFTKCDVYRLQGKKFLKMTGNDLVKYGPAIWWTIDKPHSLGTTTYVGERKFPLFLNNFALTHLQECLYEKAELECILCEIGYCKMEEKRQPWITGLHKQIETANSILYN
ncbi:MAG: hypothetical protein EPO62_05220 [Candidatus Nitrosotenuis sp.]|nr:MAG: hypothetical protein EPO62_05220 [Candidatus Nitrosotenuis sp.]